MNSGGADVTWVGLESSICGAEESGPRPKYNVLCEPIKARLSVPR